MNLSRTRDPYLTQEATLTSSFGAPASQVHLIDDEGTALLPPPIDDERSCKWCYAADACMLYRKVSPHHPLRRLSLTSIAGRRRGERDLI